MAKRVEKCQYFSIIIVSANSSALFRAITSVLDRESLSEYLLGCYQDYSGYLADNIAQIQSALNYD